MTEDPRGPQMEELGEGVGPEGGGGRGGEAGAHAAGTGITRCSLSLPIHRPHGRDALTCAETHVNEQK